jgi:DNA primase
LPDPAVLHSIDLPGVALLNELIVLCQQDTKINSAQLIEHYRGTEQGQQLTKLMCWQHHVVGDAAEHVFLDSIEKLLDNFVAQRIEVLLQKARSKQINASEEQELQSLLRL